MGLTTFWQTADDEQDITKPPADANAAYHAAVARDDLEAIVDAQHAILVRSEAAGMDDAIALLVLAASRKIERDGGYPGSC